MRIKFFHQTFIFKIEHELFDSGITIQTQGIVDHLIDIMFSKIRREEIVFAHGGESYDFAEEFVSQRKEYFDGNGTGADIVFAFLEEHEKDVVSHLESEISHVEYAGHHRFICTYSDFHDEPQMDKLCEKCAPLVHRSIR
tara:strand:+ start:940 stop:1359 length:420 start_codon:yes stop_codon:yes gene_type:complete